MYIGIRFIISIDKLLLSKAFQSVKYLNFTYQSASRSSTAVNNFLRHITASYSKVKLIYIKACSDAERLIKLSITHANEKQREELNTPPAL